MPRGLFIIILLLVAVAGLLWFLSNQAEEVPTRPMEVPVSAAGDAN